MENDNFEPFLGLPLTREQDAEIRAHIAHKLARDEPWDTLGFSYMLKDMLTQSDFLDDTDDGGERSN